MQKLLESSQIPETNWLNIEDFELLCFDLARELLAYGEPIPDYSQKENGLLESALASPRQTFGEELLYPTLTKQASILFYLLIKNHPFRNGNKRIAVISLLMFLSLNKKWLDLHPDELYELACRVSESDPKQKDIILEWIEIQIISGLADE